MKKISFLGIGLMGLPMAKNLIKNNYQLNVFNRTLKKTEPLKGKATISKSIGECIKDSEVVITMLSDDLAIEAVMKNSEFVDNLKSNYSAPMHFSEHTFKSLKYDEAPGVRV